MSKETQPATFTLRIPRELKEKAEEIAAREHMSMNTWILRLLEREARPKKAAAK